MRVLLARPTDGKPIQLMKNWIQNPSVGALRIVGCGAVPGRLVLAEAKKDEKQG